MTVARIKFINDNIALAESVTQGSGIYPEVLLAQAIVESQAPVNGVYTPGASKLAAVYKNYFGIKATPDWKGRSVNMRTREFVNTYVDGNFRVYDTKADSFRDYVKFLKSNPRYTAAGVFKAKTALEQMAAIAKAGYATDPNYSAVLSAIVKTVAAEIKKKVTPKPPL
jgi:peptidoglycan hydrolase FlgJ